MHTEKLIDGYYVKLNGRIIKGPFDHEQDAQDCMAELTYDAQFVTADYYAKRDEWLENAPFNNLVNELTYENCCQEDDS
ncbi:MAG: hypothetical protein MN733_33975 [Nitrososphaera sp.]|nr:hypothetical protein [Nitrososphaera sp.]